MTTVDLDAIREEYLKQCWPHDFGLVEYGCNCPSGEPRWAIQQLADEVERLRQELDEARALLFEASDAWHTAEAERDRLRPVLEELGPWADCARTERDQARQAQLCGHDLNLLKAFDAHRSATPDAEPAQRPGGDDEPICWHTWVMDGGVEIVGSMPCIYGPGPHDDRPHVSPQGFEWDFGQEPGTFTMPTVDAEPAPGVPVDTEEAGRG